MMRGISTLDERPEAGVAGRRDRALDPGGPLAATRRLRTSLRRALPGFEPGLRILAEGLPAGGGAIDLLGADADGRLVLVFVEPGDREADGALAFARALANRAWVQSEMPGWLQLVPDLDVTPRTEVRCLLLLRELAPSVRAAIRALPDGWIEPVLHRPYTHRGDEFLLLEQVDRRPEADESEQVEPGPEPLAESAAGGSDPPAESGRPLPALRSGLSRSDFAQRGPSPTPRRRSEPPRPRFDAAPGATTRPTPPRDTER